MVTEKKNTLLLVPLLEQEGRGLSFASVQNMSLTLEELHKICPPARELTIPQVLPRSIKSNYIDSNDLRSFLAKEFVDPNLSYKVYPIYDILTKVYTIRVTFDNSSKYYYVESRPIHYGWFRHEKSFVIQSPRTLDSEKVVSCYYDAVDGGRIKYKKELKMQRATYDDTLFLNRRIMSLNLRIMGRMTDYKAVVFRFDWNTGQLL